MAPSDEEKLPDLFLEDLRGEEALKWVEEENKRARSSIIGGADAKPEDDELFGTLKAIFEDKKRIPAVKERGGLLYNFWQDEDHVKGIWRRTTWEEYRKDEPEWELVLDIDALAKEEDKSWVFGGSQFLDYGPGPDEKRKDRVMISLSVGGSDATEVREFDVVTKQWVKPEDGGYFIPESKNTFCWVDRDTMWVGTDHGEGTLSMAGYPITCREWKRGTPLADAPVIFKGEVSDVVAAGMAYWDKGVQYKTRYRATTFYDFEYHCEHRDGEWVKVDIPSDFRLETFGACIIINCKSEWEINGEKYPIGTVLSHPKDSFLDGDRSQFTKLYEPKERCTYETLTDSKDYLYLHALEQLQSTVHVWHHDHATGAWTFVKTHRAENCQTLSVAGVDNNASNELFISSSGFLNPATYLLATAPDLDKTEVLKTNTVWFDTEGMSVTLHDAVSEDGTKVPYFQVSGAGQKEGTPVPTILYGYGGFEVSMLPHYSGATGKAFLEKGMCYVLSCIRGGGEFGPSWHRAAKKEKRHRAYEDFVAIAQDLVARGVTTPEQLGCIGGSNGGLLTGVMAVHHGKHFGAVVSQCPLLDMERYVLHTSGPSWIDEYGDPSVQEEKEALMTYSPYHHVKEATGEQIPALLFTTSTADDRVHPSHARRTVHKLRRVGAGDNVLYHEMTEGGHAGAADKVALAKVKVVEYRFLIDALHRGDRKVKPPAPAA